MPDLFCYLTAESEEELGLRACFKFLILCLFTQKQALLKIITPSQETII